MSWYSDTITLLSLDTSSTKTGWAVFENGIYKISGVINSEKIKNSEQRIKTMYLEIINVVEQYCPDILVVEKDVVGSGKRLNMSTINVLVKLIGGIWGYCMQQGLKIFYTEYSPPQWRSIIGLEGRKREEYKDASIQRVKEQYGIEVDDNEADAINIGLAYIKQWS